jgi:hypothetical protein
MLTMTIFLLRSVVAAVAILMVGEAVSAHDVLTVGRWSGIGWSDGYHSHAGCPPKPRVVAHHVVKPQPVKQKPIPWWMVPAADAEQLPAPTPSEPADGSSVVGQGVIRR